MEFGLVGEKLGHSFSKEIHESLCGYDYSLCELPPEALPGFLSGREFKGINVTIPYKQSVIPLLDGLDESARRIGAVNTVLNINGRLVGYNTDFDGMKMMLAGAGIDVKGKKALILGSGGTSKTAISVLECNSAREVYRVSRTGKDGCITYESAVRDHSDAEIIINATPCGMFPNVFDTPLSLKGFASLSGVADVIYNPLNTVLCLEAASRGVKHANGLYMLVAQAACAARIFTGGDISTEKVEKVFRRLLRSKQNVVLVGMPGAGKSTVGGLVSKALGRAFYDTDDIIAARAGKPIPRIFAESGEKYFRDLESEVIKELAPRQGAVIATGGGAVLRTENLANLRMNGYIFFIDRPLEALSATSDRPLSNSRESLEKRFAERYDIYLSCCDKRIHSHTAAIQAAESILEEYR